jgi:hypothetical protein
VPSGTNAELARIVDDLQLSTQIYVGSWQCGQDQLDQSRKAAAHHYDTRVAMERVNTLLHIVQLMAQQIAALTVLGFASLSQAQNVEFISKSPAG